MDSVVDTRFCCYAYHDQQDRQSKQTRKQSLVLTLIPYQVKFENEINIALFFFASI